MDRYTLSAMQASELLTKNFSTSFSAATSLFPKAMRAHIYSIYGLVRVADEVVDTYQGGAARQMLDSLESEVYATLRQHYSPNPVVHAYCVTANQFGIGKDLIEPFFASMRMDLTKKSYDEQEYTDYIYGSADVVGLMCLKVFVDGDDEKFQKLSVGAKALGSGFQKVNFLRDIKDDYETRGRYYFPAGSYQTITNTQKQRLVSDMRKDFRVAKRYLIQLPRRVQPSVRLALAYYEALLNKLDTSSIDTIKSRRLSVHKARKLWLLIKARVDSYVGS